MTALIELYRKNMASNGNLGREAAPSMSVRTGIDLLDFRLAYTDMGTGLPVIGIPTGRMLYLVSKSGVGKSTLAAQISKCLWSQYPGVGFTNYFDKEQSMSYERMATLEPFNMPISHVVQNLVLTNQNVYSETIEASVRQLHAIKMQQYAQGLKVPVLDSYGNHRHNPISGDPEYMPPPTIFVLDSLYMLSPQKYLDTAMEDGTNMDSARIVAANSTMLKSIITLMEEANIMLVVINHLRKKIQTTPYPTAAQLNYLKPDESLPGGDPPIYLARTMGKLTSTKKLKAEEEYGIDGYVVTWMTLKSMNSRAGQECQLIYNPERGFDNDLTNLHFLRTMGLLEGRGRYRIPGYTKTFTFKNFKQMLWDDREFALAFQSYTWHQLMHIVPKPGAARLIDAYSGTIIREGDVDVVDKVKIAMASQCDEGEKLEYDQSQQKWYAYNLETSNIRWLEPIAV